KAEKDLSNTKARKKSAQSPILKGAARSIRLIRYREQHRKRHGIVFEPMPIIEKHHVHPYSNAVLFHSGHRRNLPLGRQSRRTTSETGLPYYRTPVSGVLRRKDSGFVVCGKTWPAFRGLGREAGMHAGCGGRFTKTGASE